MIVIGLTGKSGSGKTTIARMLRVLLENSDMVLLGSFNGPLKSIARMQYDWNGRKDDDGRRLLQMVGDEYRKEDPEYWVNHLKGNIYAAIMHSAMLGEPINAVLIDDIRYHNEARFIRSMGGIIIAVCVPPEKVGHETWREHSSETDMNTIEVDMHITNAKDGLDHLFAKLVGKWPEIGSEAHEQQKPLQAHIKQILKETPQFVTAQGPPDDIAFQ